MSISTTSTTEERALSLLGQGIPNSMVAAAIGVSESRISQLLSDPVFAEKLVVLKYEALIKHSKRDNKADRLEDLLLDKLLSTCEFLMDPLKIAAIYSKVNAARRRDSSTPEAITQQNVVVQLTIPTVISQHFTQNNQIEVNVNNQVVRAGNQELITVQSANMDRLLSASKVKSQTVLENGARNEQTSLTG